MEAVIWIYIVIGFCLLAVMTFVTIDWASGRRHRLQEGHDALVWALGAILDDIEDGEIASTGSRGNETISHARFVWLEEFNRLDK